MSEDCYFCCIRHWRRSGWGCRMRCLCSIWRRQCRAAALVPDSPRTRAETFVAHAWDECASCGERRSSNVRCWTARWRPSAAGSCPRGCASPARVFDSQWTPTSAFAAVSDSFATAAAAAVVVVGVVAVEAAAGSERAVAVADCSHCCRIDFSIVRWESWLRLKRKSINQTKSKQIS